MMRIGPPQQGHGSRRMSGMTSAAGAGGVACSGCGVPSKVRIFVILTLRVALASRL